MALTGSPPARPRHRGAACRNGVERSSDHGHWMVTYMQDGSFPVELVNGVPVVTVPEEIDITNAPELRSALVQAAAAGSGTIVADLTRTRFCDSSGLHTLLAAHKRAQADDGELLLVLPGAPVLRVFALTGIDHMIPNFTSLDEALARTPSGLSREAG